MSTGNAERPKRTPQEVALRRLRRKLEREAGAAAQPPGNAPPAPSAPASRSPPAPASRLPSGSPVPSASPSLASAPPSTARRPATSAGKPATRSARQPPGAVAAIDWRQRVDAYERLIRLDKPIGWMLLLWPTLSALWIAAWGRPLLSNILIFVVGTILMRSAGCALNDWADRDFDGKVKRTADRPLATGAIAPREALIVAAVLAACAFALVCFTNRTTILLSIPALLIAIAYPFIKRFFALPQAFLGIAFSFGIPMAFAAETGRMAAMGWLMLAINLFWVVAYDTEYAMVDRDDDVATGMRTSAITFGRHDVTAVGICYAVYLLGMAWVGHERLLGIVFYAGLVVAAAIAGYHVYLIRDRQRDACFRAFRHNAWFGATVFVATVLALLIKFDAWPTLH